MIASPKPVALAPQIVSLQYVPPPIIGVSPIRPGSFPVIPPVEVAAAISPLEFIATAPTVPFSWLNITK